MCASRSLRQDARCGIEDFTLSSSPRTEVSGEPADGGRRPTPSAVDDEQDRDAEERRGRRDRAQDDHELTRPDGPARTDRGQRRRRSATEPRKPRYAGPRDRAAERTSRVLPRKTPKGLEPLVRNRAGSGTQSDDQARNPEESRE